MHQPELRQPADHRPPLGTVLGLRKTTQQTTRKATPNGGSMIPDPDAQRLHWVECHTNDPDPEEPYYEEPDTLDWEDR